MYFTNYNTYVRDVPYTIKINYLKIDVVFWKLQTLALYVHDKWTIFYYGWIAEYFNL